MPVTATNTWMHAEQIISKNITGLPNYLSGSTRLLAGGVARWPPGWLCGCSAATPMQSLPSSIGGNIQHKMYKRYAMHRSLELRQGETEAFLWCQQQTCKLCPRAALAAHPPPTKQPLSANAVLFRAPHLHRTQYYPSLQKYCASNGTVCHCQTRHGHSFRVNGSSH